MINPPPLLTISETQMMLEDILAVRKKRVGLMQEWIEVEERKTRMTDECDPFTQSFLKLLDLGLDPNTIIDRTQKPIMCEIAHPNMTPRMLEALLERGVTLDLFQKYELKPLVFCLRYQPFNLEWKTKADLLVRFGMDVGQPDTDGTFLLQHMSSSGQKKWIEWLMEQGADPYAKDQWGINSFSVAGLEAKIQKGSFDPKEKPPTQDEVVGWILDKYSEIQQKKLEESTPKALSLTPGKRL